MTASAARAATAVTQAGDEPRHQRSRGGGGGAQRDGARDPQVAERGPRGHREHRGRGQRDAGMEGGEKRHEARAAAESHTACALRT